MPVIGQDIIAKNIIKFGGQFTKRVNVAMKEVQKALDYEITKNMSLSDHSLEDIRKAGSPYSRRKYGDQGQSSFHDPYWLVHRQSGALLESKSAGTVDATIDSGQLKAEAFVKLDPSKAQHALYVIFGTSKMIPRPFLMLSRDKIAPAMYIFMRERFRFLNILAGG